MEQRKPVIIAGNISCSRIFNFPYECPYFPPFLAHAWFWSWRDIILSPPWCDLGLIWRLRFPRQWNREANVGLTELVSGREPRCGAALTQALQASPERTWHVPCVDTVSWAELRILSLGLCERCFKPVSTDKTVSLLNETFSSCLCEGEISWKRLLDYMLCAARAFLKPNTQAIKNTHIWNSYHNAMWPLCWWGVTSEWFLGS